MKLEAALFSLVRCLACSLIIMKRPRGEPTAKKWSTFTNEAERRRREGKRGREDGGNT